MENKEFDKLIASELSDKKYPVSVHAWERLEKELRVSKKVNLKKWRWAAVVSLIVGISVVYQLNKTDINTTNTENIPISTTEDHNVKNIVSEKNSLEPQRDMATTDVKVPVKKMENKNPHNPIKQSNDLADLAVLQTTQHQNPNDNFTDITTENLAKKSESHALAEQDYTQLVMSKLKPTRIKVDIDAADLLKITEHDMQNNTNKTLRQLAIQKFKSTVHDLNIALND